MNLSSLRLLEKFDPISGRIDGAALIERHLLELKGCFQDTAAFESALVSENPLVYSVSSIEPASGEGDLHYGLGVIQPGRVGNEYFQTKGHLHAWRPAAEVYMGLAGEGAMLLEDESSGESRLLPLAAQRIVYVPGGTAHRTVNTGPDPLVYFGIYSARAGHDYAVIAERGFRSVVVERDGVSILQPRS